jgi:cytochrome P450
MLILTNVGRYRSVSALQTFAQEMFKTVLSDVCITCRSHFRDVFVMMMTSSVRRITLPSGISAWVVTDCRLARKVLNDQRFSKRRLHDDGSTHYLYRHMLTLDPPEHTRLRTLVAGHFLPGRIQQMREQIEADCDALLIGLRARDRVDLVAAFARPLALRTICALTGIPREDAPRIENWSKRLVRADFEDPGQFPVIADEMCGYFDGLDPRGGIFGHLADAVARGALDRREMYSMTFLLLNAGYETSANLISSGVLALLSNPPQWSAYRADQSLPARAVEELLRFESPLQMSTPRFASEDVVLDGETIPAGDMIFVGLGEANRDAAQFPDPDRLDVRRENSGQHMAFGHGVHFCIGAPLARLEGEIAIAAFARHFPNARYDEAMGPPVWEPGFVVRGLCALHLVLM